MKMKENQFDANDPPTVANPLPRSGNAPGMRLLREWMRKTLNERVRDPIPVAERADMMAIERALSASLSAATTSEVRQAVTALLNHYPSRPLSEEAAAAVLEDWITDLRTCPADVILAACQQWRREPNTFAPTPGHIIERAEPIMRVRQVYLRMARDALGVEAAHVPERKAG
ncbi:hypothetical protein [Tropicimonas isoalkanivorans]|uniref:Uncharacterized protein n=1 Tax=Tropicimonas isoalkanivorans TaxID=441112 RepID=A0A1I1J7I6_9RHOB|nr:hypothetical protein [Tropicimonas isoalkanivorans]SFC44579.1 hypothetical protein SAMN04488094_10510 [Tropicimonas isoalkanivorans]